MISGLLPHFRALQSTLNFVQLYIVLDDLNLHSQSLFHPPQVTSLKYKLDKPITFKIEIIQNPCLMDKVQSTFTIHKALCNLLPTTPYASL